MQDVCQYHDDIKDSIYSLKEDIAVIKNDISNIRDTIDRMESRLNNATRRSISLSSIPVKDIVLYVMLVIIGIKTWYHG